MEMRGESATMSRDARRKHNVKPAMDWKRRLGRRVADGLSILLLTLVLVLHAAAFYYALQSRKYIFQDFRCYYRAAAYLGGGRSPYYHPPGFLSFVYMPTTLYLFKCFSVY